MLPDGDTKAVCTVLTLPDALNHTPKHYDGPGNLRQEQHLLVLFESVREPQITSIATEIVEHRGGSKVAITGTLIQRNRRKRPANA